MSSQLKDKVIEVAELLKGRLINLHKKIHNNPELSLIEYKASRWLCEELENVGFTTELGIVGLDTAFRADYIQDPTLPTIAFIAEYDALPEIGHGCGHSLISPAAIGAAIVLKLGRLN